VYRPASFLKWNPIKKVSWLKYADKEVIYRKSLHFMKFKYCPDCQKAYVKSRLEKEKCIYCGKQCRVIKVRRTGQYYLGYALMLISAIAVLVLRIQDVNSVLIWATLVLFVVSGGILVVVAGDKMAKSAAELVEEENSKEKNENTG
jgi:hypothetical protein